MNALSRPIQIDRKKAAACVFLLVMVSVVFGQTIRHEFINFDDPSYVYENPHVPRGLTTSGIAWAFTQGFHSIWAPSTWISLMIDWELYDVHAGGYHLTNLLLHAATAMLLFLALVRMTDRFWPSVFAAALFAIHPLRVESVAWVTERKDVLSGMFFMLAILAYIHYAKSRFSFWRYLLVCVLYAIGLMAKPMLVTFPGVLLLLDYWPLQRACFSRDHSATSVEGTSNATGQGWRSNLLAFLWLVMEKVPFLLIAIAVGVITMRVQESYALASNEVFPLTVRLQYVVFAYVIYLWHFIYPIGLLPVYPRHELILTTWKVASAATLLLAITITAFCLRRKRPYVWMGWLWYLGTLIPVVGFVQVGLTAVANRFTYLPSIGLGIAIVWTIADWCKGHALRTRTCSTIGAIVLAILMACATHQTSFWRDNESLWAYVLSWEPNNCVAHTNYASQLFSDGRQDEARKHYRLAVASWPASAITQCNMGCVLMDAHEYEAAKKHFIRALQCNRDYITAYNRLGILFREQKKYDESIAFFDASIKLDSTNPTTYYDLSKTLRAKGMKKEAEEVFRKAAALNPSYAENQYQWGVLVASRRCNADAIEHFQRALDAKPDFSEARIRLAELLVAEKRYQDAYLQCQVLLRQDPDNALAKALLKDIPVESQIPSPSEQPPLGHTPSQ